MNEPRLENIRYYNNFQAEKKRAYLAVILSGLIMGSLYAVVSVNHNNANDTLHISKTLNKSI